MTTDSWRPPCFRCSPRAHDRLLDHMNIVRRRLRAVGLLLVVYAVLAAAAGPALAAARCPKTTELALEDKVMCQVCGLPLALASSAQADRERAFITTLVNRCESVSQIEAAMVAQYGPGILATPGTGGFAITAWLIPGLAILAAGAGIGAVLLDFRRRRGGRSEPIALPPASDSEEARLDAALQALGPHS